MYNYILYIYYFIFIYIYILLYIYIIIYVILYLLLYVFLFIYYRIWFILYYIMDFPNTLYCSYLLEHTYDIMQISSFATNIIGNKRYQSGMYEWCYHDFIPCWFCINLSWNMKLKTNHSICTNSIYENLYVYILVTYHHIASVHRSDYTIYNGYLSYRQGPHILTNRVHNNMTNNFQNFKNTYMDYIYIYTQHRHII